MVPALSVLVFRHWLNWPSRLDDMVLSLSLQKLDRVSVLAMMMVGEAPWKAALYGALGPLTEVRAREALEKRAASVTVKGYISAREARGVTVSVGASRWRRGRAEVWAPIAATKFWACC